MKFTIMSGVLCVHPSCAVFSHSLHCWIIHNQWKQPEERVCSFLSMPRIAFSRRRCRRYQCICWIDKYAYLLKQCVLEDFFFWIYPSTSQHFYPKRVNVCVHMLLFLFLSFYRKNQNIVAFGRSPFCNWYFSISKCLFTVLGYRQKH